MGTTALVSLFQCPVTLAVKNFFLISNLILHFSQFQLSALAECSSHRTLLLHWSMLEMANLRSDNTHPRSSPCSRVEMPTTVVGFIFKHLCQSSHQRLPQQKEGFLEQYSSNQVKCVLKSALYTDCSGTCNALLNCRDVL